MTTENDSAERGRGPLAEFSEAIGGLIEQVADLGPRMILGGGPRHELRIEDDGYRVLVEMPGVQREAIDVSVKARRLRVKAERPPFEPPEGARRLRLERASGSIELRLQLPDEVDAQAVVAQLSDGMLEIKLPRPSARGRSIEVENAESAGKAGAGSESEAMPWEEAPPPESDEGKATES